MLARGAPYKTLPRSAGVSCPATPGYRARDPRGAVLNRIVTDTLPEFKLWMRDHQPDRRSRPHPAVITAMEKFTECGDMRFGAVRFRCPDCGHDMFVAFSCKRRGLCPSCDAKRASIITTDASDRLLPPVPYRQWVLVVPKRLRWYLNQRSDLPGELSRVFAKEIARFLRGKASGTPIQLHFVQRFGGELNLHIHIHAVVSDGVFNHGEDGKLCYTPVCGPTETELAAITEAVRRKVIRRLRRIGGLCAEAAEQLLSWKHSGFSIHEEVRIEADDKQGREHLLYYCARPALSQARLVYSAKKQNGRLPHGRAGRQVRTAYNVVVGISAPVGTIDAPAQQEPDALLWGTRAALAASGQGRC